MPERADFGKSEAVGRNRKEHRDTHDHGAGVQHGRKHMDTISLIIGYKLKQQEDADNAREKARLEKQLSELEEAQKTPGELIAELKAKIASL